MSENTVTLASIYKGWDVYQQLLVKTVSPLTQEQLNLRISDDLRNVSALVAHIVGARARWFYHVMGIGGPEIVEAGTLDRRENHTTAELVEGLETTWQTIQESLNNWTVADLDFLYEGEHGGEAYSLSRQWIIWHLIEHDLHHGGELSFSLGMHGVAGIDL